MLGKPLRAVGAYGDLAHCRRLVFQLSACREALAEYCELPAFDPEAVMNRERTRVRRWLARPEIEAVLRSLARYLTQSTMAFGWDLDGFVGYERSRVGRPALPFPSFHAAPEYQALLKWHQAKGERVAA